jgi:predicted XRE-type DNA-binding protein
MSYCQQAKRSATQESKMSEEVECYEGSGNVFADIGLENADELLVRALIGVEVLKILQARKLRQREIATLLGIKQSEVSHLMNGHFSRFRGEIGPLHYGQ